MYICFTDESHVIHSKVSQSFVQVSDHDGVWGLNITKVGREDAGVYVCQTDDPDMGTVSVRLDIKGNE